MTDSSRVYSAKSIKALENERIYTSSYDNLFQEIARVLGGDSAFSQPGPALSCTYINYWLNKEVKTKKYGVLYNKESFEVIKKYADEYSKEKYKNVHNTCKPYIEYIDSDKYQKMSRLYELYDFYSELDIPNYIMNDSKCETLGNLTRKHNEIIKDYEDEEYTKNFDNDLIEKRMKIKDLIKNLKLTFPKFCYYNYRLELDTSNFEEKRKEELKRQELEKKMEIERKELEQKQALQRLEEAKEQTSLLTSQTIDIDSREYEVHQAAIVTQDGQRDDILTNPHIETRGNLELSATENSRISREKGRLYNSSVYQQEDNFYPSKIPIDSQLNADNTISEEGIMGTMKNAISGFMNEVEPAPILGVSGGMGALFLLFKLGHSLEEEEELIIESPVLSMDNLQEDLQDMMIFMKEVLDQVQLIYLTGLNWNNILVHQSMSIE
ncbi:hypothetical protein PVIIG_06016 [Plasmodium vivax India VII]|uniref:VIR protein n=2 Tax=Plasmodium vivax TaxID=5855 RepID=A0A0J9S4J7_PLAVI|nr:hypothetical protein PVIIG_06016 [Plasmodium vivax India VII]